MKKKCVICLDNFVLSCPCKYLHGLYRFINLVSNSYDNTIVIFHDCEIREVIEIKPGDQFRDFMGIARGGSSHQKAFELIKSLLSKGDKIDKIYCVSDFYSDIERTLNKFEFVLDTPIWLLAPTEYYNRSITIPVGAKDIRLGSVQDYLTTTVS